MKFKTFVFLLLALSLSLGAESLWDSQSQSLISGKTRTVIGDLLQVQLEMEGSLSFSSVKTTDKTLNITLERSSGANPLEFLPSPSAQEDYTVKGKNELKLQNKMMVSVVAITENGHFLVEGTKEIRVSGHVERMTLQGRVDPRFLKGNALTLDVIADLRLIITTLSEGAAGSALAETDLETGGPLRFQDGKQREMLLQLYNRFLSSVFLNP